MVGYGPEDTHFVVELTYNYTVKSYDLGNDYNCITIKSKTAFANAQAQSDFDVHDASDASLRVAVTGGYHFKLVNEDVESGCDPVQSLTLNVGNLVQSLGISSAVCLQACDVSSHLLLPQLTGMNYLACK
jgi:hypothetical protein